MRIPALLAAALLAAACSAAPAASPAATQSGATPRPPDVPGTGLPSPAATEAPSPTPEPAASLVPGDMSFRVVNLYRDASGQPAPVDVYMRSQGLVQAEPVEMGLAYGEATDFFAPPDPGDVVVTTAGAGDPTCVSDCPHIVSSASTNFGEGDKRTLVVHPEGTLDLWHNPDPESVGTIGNALVPGDPSTALLYVVGIGLQNTQFGLRLGFEGVDGCQENRTSASMLVGGNQVAIFGFDGGSADVLLYENLDSECTGEPVGGPFPVTGDAGSRTLLVLFGEPGDMGALTLEL